MFHRHSFWISLFLTGSICVTLNPFVFAGENTNSPLEASAHEELLNITDDLSVLEEQVKAYPNNPEAHLLLAVAYTRHIEYFERAIKTLRRAKRLIKKSPEGYKTADKLIEHYEQILTYRPNDAKVLYRLAFGYYLKGYGIQKNYIKNTTEQPDPFFDKAEATMRQAIAADPTDIWAKDYLGYLLVERNPEQNLDPAIQIWEDALQLDAKHPGTNILLGEAYLKKGDLKKALQYASQSFHIWDVEAMQK